MKKICLIVSLLYFSFPMFSQVIAELEYAYMSEPYRNEEKTNWKNEGFSTGVNIDFRNKKRIGWNLGFEFSERKENPSIKGFGFCGTGVSQTFLDLIENGYYVQRYGLKMGTYFVPLQKSKLTWKVGMNLHYFIESGMNEFSNDILSEIKDNINASLVIKNTIQYQIAKKTYINLNQSYENFNLNYESNYRVHFGVGLGYKF